MFHGINQVAISGASLNKTAVAIPNSSPHLLRIFQETMWEKDNTAPIFTPPCDRKGRGLCLQISSPQSTAFWGS